MKQHIVTVLVTVMAVVAALALFFAGFFVRGWVDRELAAASTATNPLPQETTQPLATATSAVQPLSTATAPPGVTPTIDAATSSGVGPDDDPARGPADARVTIIEFSDYQCPFCARYVDQTLPLVLATYGDRVRYVFRDFPIAELHPQAVQAAQAAQCAVDQGRFWEYHEMLFQNQGALDTRSLKEYASKLGMDAAVFANCLDSQKYAAEVQRDFDDARTHGVTGTPTFFINGRKLVGAQSFATFQKVIDEELRK